MMGLFEWICAALVASVLVAAVVMTQKTSAEFRKVCDEARGTTVWDGRQYQCIKPVG